MAGSASLARMAVTIGSAGAAAAALGPDGAASGAGALVLEGTTGSGSALGVAAAVSVRGSAPLSGSAVADEDCVPDVADDASAGGVLAPFGATPAEVGASSARVPLMAGSASASASQPAAKPAAEIRPPISPPCRHTLDPQLAKGHSESMLALCPLRRTPRKSLAFLAHRGGGTWTSHSRLL